MKEIVVVVVIGPENYVDGKILRFESLLMTRLFRDFKDREK